VKGSGKILAKLEEKLGIKSGDCSPDGEFSLESSRCIGACGLAPVFTVNEDVYGRVKEDGSELDGILAKYRA
ncbi:MAG: NAD(P)H-dependent oxidoreductase subunit E, partial [Oscillospiraceae bacterium]